MCDGAPCPTGGRPASASGPSLRCAPGFPPAARTRACTATTGRAYGGPSSPAAIPRKPEPSPRPQEQSAAWPVPPRAGRDCSRAKRGEGPTRRLKAPKRGRHQRPRYRPGPGGVAQIGPPPRPSRALTPPCGPGGAGGHRSCALIWARLALMVTRTSALASSAANLRAALAASWKRRAREGLQ